MNRKIDEMGRISIPKEFRDKIGLENSGEVKIELKGDKIIVTNPNEFNLKAYIEYIQLNEDVSTETYRVLNKILEKMN